MNIFSDLFPLSSHFGFSDPRQIPFCLICKVYHHDFMNARIRGTHESGASESFLLTVLVVARVLKFSCAYSPSPNSHRKTREWVMSAHCVFALPLRNSKLK